jgi:hypothetical protein
MMLIMLCIFVKGKTKTNINKQIKHTSLVVQGAHPSTMWKLLARTLALVTILVTNMPKLAVVPETQRTMPADGHIIGARMCMMARFFLLADLTIPTHSLLLLFCVLFNGLIMPFLLDGFRLLLLFFLLDGLRLFFLLLGGLRLLFFLLGGLRLLLHFLQSFNSSTNNFTPLCLQSLHFLLCFHNLGNNINDFSQLHLQYLVLTCQNPDFSIENDPVRSIQFNLSHFVDFNCFFNLCHNMPNSMDISNN